MKEIGRIVATSKKTIPVACGSVFSYYCDCMRHKWPALVTNPNGDKYVGRIMAITAEGGDCCWIIRLAVDGETEPRNIFVRAY